MSAVDSCNQRNAFRMDDDKDGRQMFALLMAKNFSCSSIRLHLAEKLSTEDVMRLTEFAIEIMGRHSTSDQFEKV